jgi:hypothetical protein
MSSGCTKAIIVTGRDARHGCEMLRFPHFLDILLTDGGKVVSPMQQGEGALPIITGTQTNTE